MIWKKRSNQPPKGCGKPSVLRRRLSFGGDGRVHFEAESKRMMFEEESLLDLAFFALNQGTTSVVPPLVEK
jgi:hypothetical protein